MRWLAVVCVLAAASAAQAQFPYQPTQYNGCSGGQFSAPRPGVFSAEGYGFQPQINYSFQAPGQYGSPYGFVQPQFPGYPGQFYSPTPGLYCYGGRCVIRYR